MRKEEVINEKELEAKEIVNVRDIKNGILYTKDGYRMKYLKVEPFNLDLLSKDEKRLAVSILTASLKKETQPYAFMSISKPVDLNEYKKYLNGKLVGEISNVARKLLLEEMNREAIILGANGENFEHQYFVKIWQKIKKESYMEERELQDRIEGIKDALSAAKIKSRVLSNDTEIIKLCNLFGNSATSPHEVETIENLLDIHSRLIL